MFVRLAFVDSRPFLAAAAVLLLTGLAAFAGSRIVDEILSPKGTQLGETGSVTQNPGS